MCRSSGRVQELVSEKACRNCKLIVMGSVCPRCKGTNLSEDFTGIMIVLDTEKSEVAKRLGIDEPGEYAIKVR